MSEITRQGDQTIVRPGGDMVASGAPALTSELQSLIEGGTKELVIDLRSVDIIDSTGLSVLMNSHKSLSNAGGRLTLTNVSKDIYGLFKAMQLDQHFAVVRA